jgi:hypothetical protein
MTEGTTGSGLVSRLRAKPTSLRACTSASDRRLEGCTAENLRNAANSAKKALRGGQTANRGNATTTVTSHAHSRSRNGDSRLRTGAKGYDEDSERSGGLTLRKLDAHGPANEGRLRKMRLRATGRPGLQ